MKKKSVASLIIHVSFVLLFIQMKAAANTS